MTAVVGQAARRRVAIVTGASRGAGRGIAVALGRQGCTVYVSGRSEREDAAGVGGTISATAAQVDAVGGRGVAVRCDHADDAQTAQLVERAFADEGRLDILVNNACAIHDALPAPGPFWEKPVEIGRMIDVGVRSGFVASWHAARRMVGQAGGGLIAFTSSPGAMHYCFGPAYGAHKAAVDKMAFDMGVDFRDAGVDIAAVSIWMGSLATERLLAMMAEAPERFRHIEGTLEPPELTGRLIWALYTDPRRAERNGATLIGAEAAREYGLADAKGGYPPSVRELHATAPPRYASYKVK